MVSGIVSGVGPGVDIKIDPLIEQRTLLKIVSTVVSLLLGSYNLALITKLPSTIFLPLIMRVSCNHQVMIAGEL